MRIFSRETLSLALMLCLLLLVSVPTVSGNGGNESRVIDHNSQATVALADGTFFNITFYVMNGTAPFISNKTGYVVFNQTGYTSGQMGRYPAGNYTAVAWPGFILDQPCNPGIAFSNWSWTGGLSVRDRSSRATYVTVVGNGTLTAVYQETSFCVSVSPLSIFTALIATLMVATINKTNRRKDPV